MSPFSAPFFSGAPKSERPLLPNRATAFREGHKKSSMRVSEDFLGGDGKAEGVKVPGAGIWPKAVPRKNERQKRAGLLNWEGRCGIG
jgi:hypothetical protein